MIRATLETFCNENVRGQEGYLGTESMLRGLRQDGPRSSWRKHTLVIICGDLGINRVAWSGIKPKNCFVEVTTDIEKGGTNANHDQLILEEKKDGQKRN